MSWASRLTLGLTCASAAGVVLFVHYGQHAERAVMHAGVIRDLEQQKVRDERRREFEVQQALEKEYKTLQNVRDVTDVGAPSKGSSPS